MAVLDSNSPGGFLPETWGKLLDTVIAAKSIAFKVGTVVPIETESINVPLLQGDPASGWYLENTQISLTDPDLDDIVVTPKAVKALTQISNEAAGDIRPAVADLIGASLGRSLAKSIDAALFASTTPTNGPAGIGTAVVSEFDTNGTWSNLDPFYEALETARGQGAELSHFVIAPDVATTLSKIKQVTGGTVGLLDAAGVNDGTVIAGKPVLVSRDVATGEAWGIDSSQLLVIQRAGTSIARSGDSVFDYDAVQVRATARVGFGVANPMGIVHFHDKA